MMMNLEQAAQVRLVWPALSNGRGRSYIGLSQWLQVMSSKTDNNDGDDAPAHIVHIVEESQAAKLPSVPPCAPFAPRRSEHFRQNCQRIRPQHFQVSFQSVNDNGDYAPIGVHIRKTDRMKNFGPRDIGVKNDFTSHQESQQAIEFTFQALTLLRPSSGVFVASDSPEAATIFKQRLRASGVSVVEPNVTHQHPSLESIPPPFLVDFFALAACREIYMVSAFSSFSAMAACVGAPGMSTSPLYSLLPTNCTNLDRFLLPRVIPLPICNGRNTVYSDWCNAIEPNITQHNKFHIPI
eukprot:CAMPEP_0176491546 /NCGR_PEP_ID=MMETSP0200_2-20121128/8491_1 /TAXON_ID=947934 /ORGANISM="Chaetoceros sp., Strain GSL56" /LENGTH=294 /DNA_ID=CAMNT_0017888985 /DNA_START=307 /DNA_END=1191 /DNA_ORIENTATION=+